MTRRFSRGFGSSRAGLNGILCWRALKDRITHQVLGNDVCVVICNNNLYNASNKYSYINCELDYYHYICIVITYVDNDAYYGK